MQNTGITLKDIPLPNEWVLYLYDKQLFKKIASKQNFQAKPYRELYSLKNVNDLMYILKIMEVKKKNCPKNNLELNDYIFMRRGIEPIWEDPKNSNGGTYTIKMDHHKGYEIWSDFLMYIMGETLTDEMKYINGITISYIPETINTSSPSKQSFLADLKEKNSYTYIKIWDGKTNRTKEEFSRILPPELFCKFQNDSIMYSSNNKKRDFNEKNIINKINNKNYGKKEKGGFNMSKKF